MATQKVPEPARWPTISAAQAAVWRECRCFTLTSDHDRLRNSHGWPTSHFASRLLVYPGSVVPRWPRWLSQLANQ